MVKNPRWFNVIPLGDKVLVNVNKRVPSILKGFLKETAPRVLTDYENIICRYEGIEDVIICLSPSGKWDGENLADVIKMELYDWETESGMNYLINEIWDIKSKIENICELL